MGEVLIDLDLLPAREPDPRVAPALRRRYPAGLVLLASALLLVASAVPGPGRFPPPVLLPSDVRADFVLAADSVYVVSRRGDQLSRYSLDGRLRWSTPVPSVSAGLVTEAGGMVLAGTNGWPGRTYAFDRVTGELRWDAAGTVFAAFDHTVVLNASAAGAPAFRLTAVTPADGAQRWWYTVRQVESERLVRTVTQGGGRYAVTGTGVVRADGSGELLDLATGTRRSLEGWPVDGGGEERSATNVGPVVLMLASSSGGWGGGTAPDSRYASAERGQTLRAFAADTLSLVWIVETRSESWGNGCGWWLCLPDRAGTRALDPATGRAVWRTPWAMVSAGTGAARGVAYAPASGVEPSAVGVVDLATGRTLAAFRGWRILDTPDDRFVPIVREVGTDSWQVASLDLQRLVAYPLGYFDTGRIGRCQVSATHLACPTRRFEIEVWRYAAAA